MDQTYRASTCAMLHSLRVMLCCGALLQVEQMFGDEEVTMDQIQGIDLRKVHMPLLVGMGLNLGHWQLFVDHFKRMLDEVCTSWRGWGE